MSNKEYEIEYNEYSNKYTVKEVEPFELSPPSTELTGREKLGNNMLNLSRPLKIFLTIFFDLYGFLYRFGSNTTTGVIVSLLQLMTFNFFGAIWIVDIISVLVKNDIVFCGRKKYKSYVPKN